MTTKVEKSIEVGVPVSTAYNQWTQFEEFPQFMGGVQEVRQLGDTALHWVAEIAGVKREWDAVIMEQVPDQKVAWAATSGATNAGAVFFAPAGADRTRVTLSLEYEPEGLVETVGDKLNVVERQAESDLEKFKEYIESRGMESGAWRGTVNEGAGVGTPGVGDAMLSQGDSGKAGMSGKAMVAGAAVAAAGAAAAMGAMRGRSGDQDTGQESGHQAAETLSGTTGMGESTGMAPSTGMAQSTGMTPSTGMAEPTAMTGMAGEAPMIEETDLVTDRQVPYVAGGADPHNPGARDEPDPYTEPRNTF